MHGHMKKAMILAAGLGKRMRLLTSDLPKPLLQVGGKPLIEYHLERLRSLGITDVVINVSYLAEKIIEFLGAGEHYGLRIQYSIEDEGPLGVWEGMQQARSLLGNSPFLLLSADVWFDKDIPDELFEKNGHSHFVLAKNSDISRDFSLDENNCLLKQGDLKSYAGIAKVSPAHLDYPAGSFCEWIDVLIAKNQASGSLLDGNWHNVGTPEELSKLNSRLS